MRTLTSAFTTRDTAFGVKKLPEWAVENTKHNYGTMQKLFTVVCRMLLPAMHMYLFTVRNKNLNLRYESDQWANTIESVKSACEEQLNHVINSLPTYIENDFDTFFNQKGFGDYDNTWWSYMVITRDTHNFFKAKYPFANFAVVAYTPMTGSSNHWIYYNTKISKLFLHKGSNGVNVHILWEKAKETHDLYIHWLSQGSNAQKLQNDINNANNWLDSHKSGNAKAICDGCPSDSSNQRFFRAYIVPNSDVNHCNSIYKSSLTKFTTHQNTSVINGRNWNFVYQRYFGYWSYYGTR